MLNQNTLQSILPVGEFGHRLHFSKRIDSTNDEAKKHAEQGAGHGTLFVADEQTAGRGRAGRAWSTPPGSAIAMSVILRPDQFSADQIGEMTVLGALATLEGVHAIGAQALIKWPNDVLTQGAKLAGVLLESSWVEAQLDYMVMGIGINIGSASIEDSDRFDFPAACLEEQLGRPIDRVEVIRKVLEALSIRCTQIGTGELMTAWDDYLAYKGQVVSVQGPQMNSTGKVVGINARGQLRLQLFTGEVLNIGVAGQHLRPVDRI